MKWSLPLLPAALIASLVLCFSAPAGYAQDAPPLGSPAATRTIDGKQLPAPDVPFGGVIKETAQDFKAILAAACRAAEGRAQCSADHD